MNKFIEIFCDSDNKLSSKRVFGGLGFIVCLIVLIICTVKVIQAPTITDAFLITCAGLLGLDTVTSIWKGNSNEERVCKTDDNI